MKKPSFITGLLVGFIAGSIVVFLVFSLKTKKNSKERKSIENELVKTKIEDEKTISATIPKKVEEQPKANTIKVENVELTSEVDSSYADTSLVFTNEIEVDTVDDQAIVIRKDILLRTMVKKIEFLADTSSKMSVTDTLLTENLDVNPNPKTESIEVEVWESPINFKGYKLGRGKLLLYGAQDIENIKLYDKNDTLYLLMLNNFYRLRTSEEFLPYNPLNTALIKN